MHLTVLDMSETFTIHTLGPLQIDGAGMIHFVRAKATIVHSSKLILISNQTTSFTHPNDMLTHPDYDLSPSLVPSSLMFT